MASGTNKQPTNNRQIVFQYSFESCRKQVAIAWIQAQI